MPDMYFGELRTPDSHSVAAGLTFSDGHLALSSDTQQLGMWPVDQVILDLVDSPTLRSPSATKGSSPVRGGVDLLLFRYLPKIRALRAFTVT